MSRAAQWMKFIRRLKIRTRDRRIVPLEYNAAQMKVWSMIADKIDRAEAIRLIVYKARRLGMSTEVSSWLMAFVASSDLTNALVTAHMSRPAKRIWSMSKLFVTSDPLLSKIAVIGNNTITIGQSSLEVSTAGSPESERSGDLTAWLASEAAFYPHPEVMLATMQALPHRRDIFSIGVIESTPNGRVGDGEMFYNEWKRAEEGDSDWVPVFLAWHVFEDYSLPNARIELLDDEEKEIKKRFELTDGQLAWRRWAIANLCQGDIDKFHQEYPATAEEGFIQSGLPFFPRSMLLPLEVTVRPGIRGRIELDGRFAKDPKGPLEVFRFPEPGHEYVIGADSSMGISDDEGKGQGHSRSAGEVIDMETLEQVAEYDASTAPHVMARHLVGMGRMYQNALIAPEVQSSGGGGGRELLVYIRESDYWNIHKWKGNVDKIRRTPSVLYGWECVDPNAVILTADLRWIPAERIKVGDEVLGVNVVGGKGGGIRIRRQTVTASRTWVATKVAVTLVDSRETRVSANHPIWAYRSSKWGWIEAEKLRPGDLVKWLPIWSDADNFLAGRLSGLLDGEGHLSRGRRSGLQLLVTQAEGPLADEIGELWRDLGFQAAFKWVRHKKRPHEKPVAVIGVLRMLDVLRALGELRPTRLLRRFKTIDLGNTGPRSFPSVPVYSVERIEDGPVVGLTTDPDHTLIADGIVGHNTNARTRPRMLARIREVVMEKSAVIHSRRLFNQLSAFGEGDSGRLEALQGHDDLLFAWGIALMSRSENYFKMPHGAHDQPAQEPNWEAMGIHVKRQETPFDRLRRLLAVAQTDDREKSFLEM